MYYFNNMSGRVVSDIQTRAEGEMLFVEYNTIREYCKVLVIQMDVGFYR